MILLVSVLMFNRETNVIIWDNFKERTRKNKMSAKRVDKTKVAELQQFP